MTFPIVAIAASAGGLEAVSELLAALPSHTGMAFVVVQHLDPGHESLLTEILSKKTSLSVQQVHDGMLVEADHVYVIPPNTSLTLADEHLHLTTRGSGRGGHRPADILFRSLAEARASSAIGVVLSGGDSDGALGIQAIKDRGGITFAQEPASARFAGMPNNAIETGCVDFVLPPQQIAHELMRLGNHPYLRPSPSPAAEAEESSEEAGAQKEETLRRVFRRLRAAHGVDFTHYKRSTLERRLARRMALQKLETAAEYATLMENDTAETAALYQDFLIRVTGFFRDPESFEGLAQRVFPIVCEGRTAKESVRIWVPGCASGEEVYSIAIALMEYVGERSLPAGIQLFGTDVSEAAIENARAGIYLDAIEQEVSPERLKRFFVKQNGHYRIGKSIRDLCIFARQDVTRDPPFSRLDLVSCRNLLIYLDSTTQRRVMQIFHYALRPHGFLMLGPSESVGQVSDLFELTDKPYRLYTRKPTPPGVGVPLAPSRQGTGVYEYVQPSRAANPESSDMLDAESAQREAERLLLARYTPVGVVVDDALNVLHFHGETGPYLEHVSGPPSLNLQRIARPQLLVDIMPAIQEARETGVEARREGLSVDGLRDVSIQVVPLKRPSRQRCYLILFEDATRRYADRRAAPLATSALPESEKDRRLAQSERETAAMREYLQTTLEEHEAVKEELKSAHEEVLSANEEFQSTNEELETSKEELQSANEELTTTNEELRNRNRELDVLNFELEGARTLAERARTYADGIIETILEPLLVLEADLKVARVNQAFTADFRLTREQVEGRLLQEIGSGQWNNAPLREKLDAVLHRGEPLANWEMTYAPPGSGHRLLSLNARQIRGDAEPAQLILLAVEDITERRANTDSLREGSRRKDEFLAMLAHELRNPLAPITHTLALLRGGTADPGTMKAYDLLERQTRRLVRLVDELLDVARISRGLIELKRESVDLGALVRQVVEAARARIEQYHHIVSLDLPERAVCVNGDPVRLEQVVSNLLENAVKYTPSGGRIALQLVAENGDAVLSVRDHGIGIAPQMLEHIFELFAQVDSTLARAGGGLGLGLTVVRRVLELHGGRIEARSPGLGHGSEFIVRLPILTPLDQATPAVVEPAPRSGDGAVRPRRVLIVDDNVDSAESMALLLRTWGHEVLVALDAVEALTLALSFKPQTALVDIGLPGMDGYELARRLRADPQHRQLHLVAMTGYGRAEDQSAARKAGFDMHFVKPAELDELEKLLARDQGDRPLDNA